MLAIILMLYCLGEMEVKKETSKWWKNETGTIGKQEAHRQTTGRQEAHRQMTGRQAG